MRLVEKENQLRLIGIADFRHLLEQFRQQPQQKRGIELRIFHQLVGGENVDDAAAVAVGAHEIIERQRRLAEEFGAALIFQHQKLALDGTDRILRHIAVLRRQFGGMIGDQRQHRAQIFQIEQQQTLLVGDAEGDVEHAFLHLVEVEQPRQQQRPHLRDGGADRMALLAEQIPEHHGETVGLVGKAHILGALDEGVLGFARCGNAGQIALDVGGEHGNAGIGQAFGENLQGDGFAGAGGARDQAVAVRQLQRQIFWLGALTDKNLAVLVDRRHRSNFSRCNGR